MTHRAATGQVFRSSIDGVRRAFQEVAAITLGGDPKDYGLHSLREREVPRMQAGQYQK